MTDASASGAVAANVRACPHCAQSQTVSALTPGLQASCNRCGTILSRSSREPIWFCAAMSAASIVLFASGLMGNLAVVETLGQRRTATLVSGPVALARDGLWELSIPVVFSTIIAPPVVVCLLLYTLIGVSLRHPPPGLRLAFALHNRLRPWAMIEVFLVGYFVAYAKLGALVHIEPASGIFALFGCVVVTVAVDAALDREVVWRAIASAAPVAPASAAVAATVPHPALECCQTCELACEPPSAPARCPRCGFALHRRKQYSLPGTVALAVSGLILYVPANVLPVLTVVHLGQGSPDTILGGVWDLLAAGQAPLAAIVFLASVAVPVFKLISLGAMVVIASRVRSTQVRRATALYRVVLLIGRWSMIDIFMESILAALVQFGTAASIRPEGGAVAFAAVVILTMFSAEYFDPRLMWDRAAV